MRRLAGITIWFAAFGAYLVFAGTLRSRNELITAAVLASAAWGWACATRGSTRPGFTLSPAHAVHMAKALLALGNGIVKTFPILAKAALLGGAPGHLLDLPFQRGAEDNPRDAARRASAVLVASFGPETLVVRAPQHEPRVLMHSILRADSPRDPRWLD